jgi:hypothetical protein
MKTPKGKLNLVINLAKVVQMMLQETSKTGKEAEGADLFFSAILYILPRTQNNANLKSNMVYIRCFRVDLQG